MADFVLTTTVLKAALIDLDATWFVQIGIFLTLYLLLRFVFFQPYVAFLRRRDDRTRGLRERAQDVAAKARDLEESLEARLGEARTRAVATRRVLVEDGARLRDAIVAKERARADADLLQAAGKLETERRSFTAKMAGTAADLAALIESRMRVEGK